jgi:hypothetical protein
MAEHSPRRSSGLVASRKNAARDVRLLLGRAARISRRSDVLRREPDVGNRAIAVALRSDPPKVHSARLSARAEPVEHHHALGVGSAVLVGCLRFS